jgi:hypothetical protein
MSLEENQKNAEVEVDPEPGTVFVLKFPNPENKMKSHCAWE